MPLRQRDRQAASGEIDLSHVIGFLKFIVCMTAGIAVLAAGGLLLARGNQEAVVIYEMVLAVNALVLAGGWFSIRSLRRKEETLGQLQEK